MSCSWDVVRVDGGIQQVYCIPTDTLLRVQASYGYDWNGQRMSLSGLYRDTLQNRMGCDSLLTLDLTVINAPLPQIVTYNRRVVMVNHYPKGDGGEYTEYGRYRWYKDDVLVADGIMDKYFEQDYPLLDGTFRVEVPADETGERWVYSNLLNMTGLDLGAAATEVLAMEVSPNPVPSGTKILVKLPEVVSKANVKLYDQAGRVVMHHAITEEIVTIVMDFPTGVYSLQVVSEDGRKVVARVIVE